MNDRSTSWRLAPTAAAAALCACALCACGQKGALYLPDHNPKQAVPASAAVPAPPAPPDANAAPATDGTTTRKAPRDPDPATAR
ncbi:MAG TPA: lipoprotein [Steroidobacteraceae bacterium]|nr:lipoprotein [Steroidobacteraceae bacterium]